LSTLKTDVYIWHYALLVVHAITEEEEVTGIGVCRLCCLYQQTKDVGYIQH